VLSVDTERAIYITEAAESTGWRWINDLPFPRDSSDYTLTVSWEGRYSSDARYTDTWRKPAKQWTRCTASNNCIDDNINQYQSLEFLLSVQCLHCMAQSIKLLSACVCLCVFLRVCMLFARVSGAEYLVNG